MLALFSLWFLLGAGSARAATLESLDAGREWRVRGIEISGNRHFSESELKSAMVTAERDWYRLWGDRPVLDPTTLERDLDRLRRFYEARGYYETQVKYDLEVDEAERLVDIRIQISEPPPVIVTDIDVNVRGAAPERAPPLPESLPIQRGDVFAEKAYLDSEQVLKDAYLRNGYAHVETTREAKVDLSTRTAGVAYTVEPGPETVFGETRVTGDSGVDPELLLRELTYRPGERFSSTKVAESRAKILALGLFSSVRVEPESSAGKPRVVDLRIEATGKSPRELRASIGYGTEDQFRGQLEWRHLNWLGNGRRLSIAGKYSAITASAAVNLIQPHFLTPDTTGSLSLTHDRPDEETYVGNFTRFTPRLEHRFSPRLSAFVGFRAEYDYLHEIPFAVERALGGVRREGFLAGPSVGAVWNSTDDPFTPKRGEVLSLTAEQAGTPWGSSFRFYKLTGEAKKYFFLGWETVLAGRLKLGVVDAIGSEDRLPIFERFYAGGERSVRGYGRRRLGPLSVTDDPLGGRTLLEGSIELRRPLWRELSGALFLDFGQVSLRPYDIKGGDVKFSSGFGLSYKTPVGPLRFDFGFPFDPPAGDRAWQIHFSIGAYF